jgi:hypothetical protein
MLIEQDQLVSVGQERQRPLRRLDPGAVFVFADIAPSVELREPVQSNLTKERYHVPRSRPG